ncbi:SH3 domain-containing protein [Nonomuraea sp. NPDC000554]|uniref:SH3 domain-containing protein n=1 Tax=Nonomuraea sp. NPDC000554 TaxID=3154259 RepID=UPI0033237945
MSISKHTVLVACMAAGGLAVAGLPAHAASSAGRPALACAYQVTHVRPVSFLNVRAGAGLRFHPVGKRRTADGRFAGACQPNKGWVAVKASDGKSGWASARYLRKVTAR